MSCRIATIADFDSLFALHREFYAQEGYPVDEAVARRAMRELLNDESLGRIVAIERDGAMVGYIAITFAYSLERGGRMAVLDELFVIADARGSGLGTLALAEVDRVCSAANVRSILLEVEFRNDSAKRLYERAGYRAYDRSVMVKRLP